jgi:hypothetical protein
MSKAGSTEPCQDGADSDPTYGNENTRNNHVL